MRGRRLEPSEAWTGPERPRLPDTPTRYEGSLWCDRLRRRSLEQGVFLWG